MRAAWRRQWSGRPSLDSQPGYSSGTFDSKLDSGSQRWWDTFFLVLGKVRRMGSSLGSIRVRDKTAITLVLCLSLAVTHFSHYGYSARLALDHCPSAAPKLLQAHPDLPLFYLFSKNSCSSTGN